MSDEWTPLSGYWLWDMGDKAIRRAAMMRGIKNSDTQSISEFLCLGFRESLTSFSC